MWQTTWLSRVPVSLVVFGGVVAMLAVMSVFGQVFGQAFGRVSVGTLAVAGLVAYVATMLTTSTVTEFRTRTSAGEQA